MKRKRHRPEEIVRELREAATLLAGGQGVEAACKQLEVSVPAEGQRQARNAAAKRCGTRGERWA